MASEKLMKLYNDTREGYVYVIEFSNRIKIGFTQQTPENRVRQIENSAGEFSQKNYFYKSYKECEKLIDRELKRNKIIGEFYDLTFLHDTIEKSGWVCYHLDGFQQARNSQYFSLFPINEALALPIIIENLSFSI